MPASSRLTRAIALGIASAPAAAFGGTLDYTLYAGIEHSNNIALSSDRPLSENVLTPGATFQYLQTGSTFQANVAGAFEYRKYLNNHFSSQTQTELAGQGNWTIAPDRLDLSIEDYAGVQPVDQLASNSPANQQQTNVLVIGPTLQCRPAFVPVRSALSALADGEVSAVGEITCHFPAARPAADRAWHRPRRRGPRLEARLAAQLLQHHGPGKTQDR